MALHIINCCVDTPDLQPDGEPEDLSINDPESVIEIVLENVFHIENAIPEHDEPDNEGLAIVKVMFNHYVPPVQPVNIIQTNADTYILPVYTISFDSQFFPEINPPPPKA